MYKHIGSKRSKFKNFAPKILLCAQLAVLSVRNANIVSEGKASELGVLNFELGIILGFAYDLELFSFDFINKGVKKPKLLNSFPYYLTVGVACIPMFFIPFYFFSPIISFARSRARLMCEQMFLLPRMS